MSDVTQNNFGNLFEYIDAMIGSDNERNVSYMESVENLIAMKHAKNSRRFSATGNINVKVCILADQIHYEEASSLDLPCMTLETLERIKSDEKLVKSLAAKYDAFIASDSIIQQIPIALGAVLKNADKAPVSLSHDESMTQKVEEVKAKKNLQMKKLLCLLCLDGSWPSH